ncbi:DUF6438 domain-containing protein [Lewinella sp. W8]|uniref:DUF6438 domain-containing protein n=1 Tax=Lewinella sp. W8 TaxID=2528208 RepID=UPI0010673F71|nr:DUF6438 domain-containing protein [Lewinella sp. W8]MTB51488.1 hypothetical protein [Lewinella sp. W8]
MRVILFLGLTVALSACQREATDPTDTAPFVTTAPAPAPANSTAPPKDMNGLARPADQAGLEPMDKRANMAPEDKIRGEVGTPEDANKMVREAKKKALEAKGNTTATQPKAAEVPSPTSVNETMMAEKIEQAPVVTLQKMPCFGDCERYTLTVYADGRMLLDAKKGLDRVGDYERTLFTTDTRDLLQQLAELQQMDLNHTYPEEEVVDIPATVVTLRDEEGNFRKVTVYGDAPEKLAELIAQLEEMAREGFWQKTMR